MRRFDAAKLRLGLGILGVLAVGLAALFMATGGAGFLSGPAVPVTFATFDQQPDQLRVALTGKLDLPDVQSVEVDRQTVKLVDPTGAHGFVAVTIKIPSSGATAAPNQMDILPYRYSLADLHVRLADGSYAHWPDLVRVTGRVHVHKGGVGRWIDAEVIEAGE